MSNILETESLEPKESSTYPFFAETDLHLPCLWKRRSGTPALAAADAPPALSE